MESPWKEANREPEERTRNEVEIERRVGRRERPGGGGGGVPGVADRKSEGGLWPAPLRISASSYIPAIKSRDVSVS